MRFLLSLLIVFLISGRSWGQPGYRTDEWFLRAYDNTRLKNKIVPLDNQVYPMLRFYESEGITGFLPQAKPFTKGTILKLLFQVYSSDQITVAEKEKIGQMMDDMHRASNGWHLVEESGTKGYGLVGYGADTKVGSGIGEHATRTTSLIAKPYLSGDAGDHITFHASLGAAIERLAPDIFYQSFTHAGQVHFPHRSIGFAELPYQFNYESIHTRHSLKDKKEEQPHITNDLAVGMIYYTELSGSWGNGAVQLSFNNQRRSWGNHVQNLVLSSTARRFPGIELKLHPLKKLRYSYLAGSLFSPQQQYSPYKAEIYGYDLGELQNMFTLHLVEVNLTNRIQVSATAGNIWNKRLELSYLAPLVFSHFSELEVGDYDNLAMSVDLAFLIPKFGKAWLSFFNDEFSFTEQGPLLRMARNRYAWQIGFGTPVLSTLLPETFTSMVFTRVTPFAYTHYPETRINTLTGRPADMTYRHDGFNLGFYLPPNSAEFKWTLSNTALTDVLCQLDNRLIIHGTNDLASENPYLIFGDIYRHQFTVGEAALNEYPLLDFTRDGIYDYTLMTELTVDAKLRNIPIVGYYRVKGAVGFAHTWWESNQSGVSAPSPKSFLNFSLGVVVDI